MSVRFHCPKCGRILGDTEHSFDAININCPTCHKTSKIGVKFAEIDKLLTKIYPFASHSVNGRTEKNYGNKSK